LKFREKKRVQLFNWNPKGRPAFRRCFTWIPGIKIKDAKKPTGLAKRGTHGADVVKALFRQYRAEASMFEDPIASAN
jgi:hypothetical protein